MAPDPQLDAIKIANAMQMNQRELDELLGLVNTIVPLFLGVIIGIAKNSSTESSNDKLLLSKD